MVFAQAVRAGNSLFPAVQFFPPVVGQQISPGISSASISSLLRLSRSGYIFDGTVLSVERVAADSGTSMPSRSLSGWNKPLVESEMGRW